MDWDEAIEEAKTNLGYSQHEYVKDWDNLIEEAKEILEYNRQEEYENFCVNAKINYDDYLKSNSWKKLREKILIRDGFICKDCGKKAEQVHHLNYNYLHTDKEKDYCVSLCYECHAKRHIVIREQK